MEGRLSRQTLVEHAGERVFVRAPIHLRALDLLGGQVVERADQLAGLGGGATQLLGQAEVAQVGMPVGGQQDVGRLDVSVDESAALG